jgi:electron transport complex protein RnfB
MQAPQAETTSTNSGGQARSLVDQINDVLPQTQCTQCGFQGCKPYAEAIAVNAAPINRCPPGGDLGIAKLALLLNQTVIELDSSCGVHKPRHIASIAPEHCIGCTLCIKACPVDAIIGGNKRRHAVIASLCTGCELCIPPCPVDCITMEYLPEFSGWATDQAHQARARMEQRNQRLIRVAREQKQRLEQKAIKKLEDLPHLVPDPDEQSKKRNIIEAALARARAQRAPNTP